MSTHETRKTAALGAPFPLWPTLGLALGPGAALGLARFAYALILPAMQRDLGWSYTLAGGLNTANALGYLLGAAGAAPLGRRLGNRTAFLLGLELTVLALLASGFSESAAPLLVWRALAGLAGAVTFVTGGALAADLASRFSARDGALIVGLYFGGVGLGIMASGLLVPALLAARGAAAWPAAWWSVGGLALLGALLSWRTVPAPSADARDVPGTGAAWSVTPLWPTLAAYFLFGVGYVSYMTFVIAFLQRGGLGAPVLAAFWVLLGAAVLASSWIWRGAIQAWRTAAVLPLIMAVLALGAALPLVSKTPGVVFASGALFGGCFLAVIAAITALVRRALPQAAWTAALGLSTAVFSVGQVLGPLLSGWLSDLTGGLSWGLGGSALLLLLGAGVALVQREV